MSPGEIVPAQGRVSSECHCELLELQLTCQQWCMAPCQHCTSIHIQGTYIPLKNLTTGQGRWKLDEDTVSLYENLSLFTASSSQFFLKDWGSFCGPMIPTESTVVDIISLGHSQDVTLLSDTNFTRTVSILYLKTL